MKKQLLWWGDAPTAATGFGTVSRNVLHAIHGTGEWDIAVRGVNYYGQAHPFPYMLLPAGYPDGDPFGKNNFLRDLRSNKWDLVVVNNDTYCVHQVAQEARQACDQTGAKLIYYYPVDLKLPTSVVGMIEAADLAVAYSRFGQQETAKVLPHVRTAVIPHGCEVIPTLPAEYRKQWRQQAFGVEITDETFVWITVNRNSVRKDIARTIDAFSVFHDYQPESILYCHCQAQDNGLDLQVAAAEAGVAKAVGFPNNYSLSSGGYPREQLHLLYRLADGFITTHLGEGWGLTITEAMAAELPVVAPNNTTMPEILGNSPLMYPCSDRVWVDNTGYRPRGTIRDIFASMRRVYEWRGGDAARDILTRNLEFTRANSWEVVGRMWVDLIGHVLSTDLRRPIPLVEALV